MTTEHPKTTMVLTRLQIVVAILMILAVGAAALNSWWKTSTNAALAADRSASLRLVLLQHASTLGAIESTLGRVDQRTDDIEKYFINKSLTAEGQDNYEWTFPRIAVNRRTVPVHVGRESGR
jgi:hypothetical protein